MGILEVTCMILSSKKSVSITIGHDGSRLNEKEIEKMIREASMFAEEDKMAFEGYLRSMDSAVKDETGLGKHLTEADKESLKDALKEGMESQPEAEIEDISAKMEETQAICNPIIQRYSGAQSGDSDDEDGEEDDHQEL